jgi:hypothetical protein
MSGLSFHFVLYFGMLAMPTFWVPRIAACLYFDSSESLAQWQVELQLKQAVLRFARDTRDGQSSHILGQEL